MRRALTRVGVVVCVAITLAVPASAHTESHGQESQPPNQPKPTRTAKQPPPPLFSKHRRGLYTNTEGLEVVDATPQSPPLDIDDPGVPDKGAYEINFTTRVDLSRDGSDFDLVLVDANYGVLPRLGRRQFPTQLKFEVALAASTIHEE